ncbi:PDZ domain-containing protein [Candidatus Peregrinibacteria bacterium]|nr:PDZ domain-containing protein [Candidatus Peregrinibacteria bacterium]
MNKNNVQKNVLIGALSGGVSSVLISFLIVNFLVTPTQSNNEEKFEAPKVEEIHHEQGLILEDYIVNAVENSTSAVVSIIVSQDVPVLEQYYEEYNSDPFGGMFNSPFGGSPFSFQVPKYRETGETELRQIGGGSGFLVSSDGYIITNKHVVSEEDFEYTVFLDDGSEYEAQVIARDPLNDIAVLKIEGNEFPYLEFGDSDALKLGQTVIAIGNPLLEYNNSVSTGVVSGLGRSIIAGNRGFGGSAEELDGVIQTDAAINPGNSGGPLLNLNGQVIGVNVAVASAENIGFSLPANTVKSAFQSVKENGKIVRPFLGIRYMQITEQLKEANNLDTDYGVLIVRGQKLEDLAVIPGSPADKAGLMENDIILEIDGEKLDGEKSLAKIIAAKSVGDKVVFKVLHKGKEKTIEVVLEALDD